MASRWQASGPAGTMLVCRNGHTMQFRLLSSPDTGLLALCTVEGCGDTALHLDRYEEVGSDGAQAAGHPPAAAAWAPPVAAPAPPATASAPPPGALQPPIQVHTPRGTHVPAPAPPAVNIAPTPAPAAVPPAPLPPLPAMVSLEPAGPSIRDLIEHSGEFGDSPAGALSHEDFERIWPDEVPYEVPLGAVAGSLPMEVRGRPGTVGLPEGWRAWSAPELATLPVQGERRHHVVLDHPDARERLFRLGLMTLPLKPPFDLLATVLECERRYGLPVAARAVALNFAGSPAYMWHIQGRVPGRILGKPDDLVPVHLTEMHAPIGPYVAQLTLLAPVDKAREGIIAVHTFIASWRWLA